MSDSEQLASDLSLCEENCKLLEDALAAANERIRELEAEAKMPGKCSRAILPLLEDLAAERGVSDKLERALVAVVIELVPLVSDGRQISINTARRLTKNARAALAEFAAIRATHTNREQSDTPTTTTKEDQK